MTDTTCFEVLCTACGIRAVPGVSHQTRPEVPVKRCRMCGGAFGVLRVTTTTEWLTANTDPVLFEVGA